MRMIMRQSLFSVCLLLLTASLVVAADGPELIPQSASAVIRMKAPKATIKEAAKFVDSVQPGYGQLVSGQAGMLGVGINNPTLQGVDQSRDWWTAVFMKADEKPSVVFIIPALDTKAMENAIDEDFDFVAHDDYGIYSEDSAAIEEISKHLESRTSPSVASLASEGLKNFVGASHLSVTVNLVNVKDVYKDELKEAHKKFLEGMADAQREIPEVPGMKLDWLPGLLEKISENVVIAVEDSQVYSVSLTLAESGVRLEDYLEFAADSRSSKFLAKHPAEAMPVLNKLPAEQLAYGSFGKSLSAMSEWSMQIVPQMLEMTEEQKAEWEEVKKLMREITFGGSAGSFSLGDLETGLLRGVALGEVSPTDKLREATAKVTHVMDGVELPGMKQEMTLKKDHEEVDGVKVDLLITNQVMEDDAAAGGLQKQMNQMFYGPDGAETRMAYLDGVYIQSVGGGTESIEKALDAYKNEEAGTDTVLARDLAALGTENNLVAVFDLQTLVVQSLKIASTSPNLPPMPFDAEDLEELELERSYIGISMATAPNSVIGKLHIPKETLQAGMELFNFFRNSQRGAGSF